MSKTGAITGSQTAILFATAIVLTGTIVGGGYYFYGRDGESEQINPAALVTPEAEQTERATPQQPQPVTTETAEVPEEAQPEVEVEDVETATNEAEVAEIPPTIEEVRVEPDGLTVVAGNGAPGSKVQLLLDGVVNTSVDVDASGKFAAVTFVEPSQDPQVLSLIQDEGKRQLASADEVIIAPTAGTLETPQTEASDVVVAAAEDSSIGTEPTASIGSAPSAETALTSDSSFTPIESDGTLASNATEAGAATEPFISDVAPSIGIDVSELGGTSVASLDAPQTAEGEDTPISSGATGEERGLSPLENLQLALADPNVTRSPAPLDRSAPNEPATPGLPGGRIATDADAAQTGGQDLPEDEASDVNLPVLETPARSRVAVLKSTEEGVEVLGRAPEVQDNVSIDTISYSSEGEVQLAGRAQQDSRAIRVYLDNTPIATLEVDPDGRWRGDLPDVDTGIYKLRVDEVASDGAVTSRLETPFKREDPDVLQASQTDQTVKAKRITVQTGNTLWAIARDRYGEGVLYVQIFEANRESIRNPDLIFPGQVFDLPE